MDRNLSNIKERILYFIEYQGEKKENFFQELGLSYANFKGIQKKSALNSDAIDKILTKYSELNAEWLLTGRGDMLREVYSNKMTAPALSPGSADVGSRIELVREKHGFTQEDFAEILKMDPSQYSKIKQGKLAPTLSQCIDICCRFKVSLDWMVLGYAVDHDSDLPEIARQHGDGKNTDYLVENNNLLRTIITLKDENSALKLENANLQNKRSAAKTPYSLVAEPESELRKKH